MNNATLLQSRVARINAESPSMQFRDGDPVNPSDNADTSCQTVQTRPLTDDERESAIKRAGDALITAYTRKEAARRRYDASSCLTDKADMDAADMHAREALRLMETLIRGRSAAQIERMERERGLA